MPRVVWRIDDYGTASSLLGLLRPHGRAHGKPSGRRGHAANEGQIKNSSTSSQVYIGSSEYAITGAGARLRTRMLQHMLDRYATFSSIVRAGHDWEVL